jgi:hypothetical protein
MIVILTLLMQCSTHHIRLVTYRMHGFAVCCGCLGWCAVVLSCCCLVLHVVCCVLLSYHVITSLSHHVLSCFLLSFFCRMLPCLVLSCLILGFSLKTVDWGDMLAFGIPAQHPIFHLVLSCGLCLVSCLVSYLPLVSSLTLVASFLFLVLLLSLSCLVLPMSFISLVF